LVNRERFEVGSSAKTPRVGIFLTHHKDGPEITFRAGAQDIGHKNLFNKKGARLGPFLFAKKSISGLSAFFRSKNLAGSQSCQTNAFTL
jgi:hypothetical protein